MKRSGPYKTYKGKINPKSLTNPQKYVGNIDNIIYRSLWERNVIYWLDDNPNVVEYASEELFFPYQHPITGKRAKYYPDFYVKMADGIQRVIEVKPLKEVTRPPEPKRKTKNYVNALATWVVNQEKWKSARFYTEKNNLQFEVWSEVTLHEMGILKSFQSKEKLLSERKKLAPANRPTRPKSKVPRPKRKS